MLCPLKEPFGKKSSSATNCTAANSTSKPFGVIMKTKAPRAPHAPGEFWDEFTVKKVLSSDCTNSLASISIAVHNESSQPVIVKSFVQYDELDDDNIENLMYEVKVYKAMVELASKIPHFATFVRFYVYKDSQLSNAAGFVESLHTNHCTAKEMRVLKVNIKKDPHVHKLLVTTMATGMSLMDYMEGSVPWINVISIIFQLLFCAYALSMMGFQHNDLHYQNIHINTKPLNKEGVYYLEGKKYVIPLPVQISIFDFDQSACLSCGENKSLTKYYCNNYGICNDRNPRFDMYTVFGYIGDNKNIMKYPDIVKMMKGILGSKPIPQHFNYRMCNETNNGRGCKAYPPNTPRSVMTPAEAIDAYYTNYLQEVIVIDVEEEVEERQPARRRKTGRK